MNEPQCSFLFQHQGLKFSFLSVNHANVVSGDNLLSSLKGNSDLIQIFWIEDGKQNSLSVQKISIQ